MFSKVAALYYITKTVKYLIEWIVQYTIYFDSYGANIESVPYSNLSYTVEEKLVLNKTRWFISLICFALSYTASSTCVKQLRHTSPSVCRIGIKPLSQV